MSSGKWRPSCLGLDMLIVIFGGSVPVSFPSIPHDYHSVDEAALVDVNRNTARIH